MYAYFYGQKWIECDAKGLLNLAKIGVVKRNTRVFLPDGREVDAEQIPGLEFGESVTIPVPPVTKPDKDNDSPKEMNLSQKLFLFVGGFLIAVIVIASIGISFSLTRYARNLEWVETEESQQVIAKKEPRPIDVIDYEEILKSLNDALAMFGLPENKKILADITRIDVDKLYTYFVGCRTFESNPIIVTGEVDVFENKDIVLGKVSIFKYDNMIENNNIFENNYGKKARIAFVCPIEIDEDMKVAPISYILVENTQNGRQDVLWPIAAEYDSRVSTELVRINSPKFLKILIDELIKSRDHTQVILDLPENKKTLAGMTRLDANKLRSKIVKWDASTPEYYRMPEHFNFPIIKGEVEVFENNNDTGKKTRVLFLYFIAKGLNQGPVIHYVNAITDDADGGMKYLYTKDNPKYGK